MIDISKSESKEILKRMGLSNKLIERLEERQKNGEKFNSWIGFTDTNGKKRFVRIPDSPEEIEERKKRKEEKRKKEKNYRNQLAIKKGYTSRYEYIKTKQEELAIKRGYRNRNEHERYKRYEKGKDVPMDKNITCSSYLGVHIAEKRIATYILSKIFKNAVMMPYGTREFDFVCSNVKQQFVDRYPQFKVERGEEYKIQIKSSCLRIDYNVYESWKYSICRNKIPEYFLLLSFDNRESLKLLHRWFIARDESLSNKFSSLRRLCEFETLTIMNTNSSLRRYGKYELMCTETYKV